MTDGENNRRRATVASATTDDLPAGARTLPATCRIKTQRDFRRVYRRGHRASGRWLTVVGHLGRSPDAARVGLSVSKSHGGAVRRNKLKRLLREAFRHERYRLPAGLDVVLIPKQRDENFPLAELRSELVRLIGKVLAGGKPNRRSPAGRKGKDAAATPAAAKLPLGGRRAERRRGKRGDDRQPDSGAS